MTFKIGDKVRIVREGYVGYVARNGSAAVYSRARADGSFLGTSGADVVESVTKIEPPVTVFQPGETIRGTGSFSATTYFIRRNGGFVNLETGFESDFPFRFTSENYALVDILDSSNGDSK